MERDPATIIRLERPQHNVSRSLIDSDVLWIMRLLRKEGHMAYLVGGAVRDILLGREPKDFDVGTDARPSELKRIFRNLRLVGRRFRIAHVFFRRKGQPEKVVDVSTFRGLTKHAEEGEIPPEDLDLTGSVFGTPEEDAWRRDFTINALFYDSSDFSIIDHTGGLADLEKKTIRLIGDPDERFAEDPVRMLRAVEFAVRLEFDIDPATAEGIRRNAHCIQQASPARLREELRQMEERGIVGGVIEGAIELGFFAPLFPCLPETEGLVELLRHLDEGAAKGESRPESAYLAALCLPTVAARCPIGAETTLEAASEAAFDVVGEFCAAFQISAHIRHLARETLISLYRLAKGKRYRAKGRFAARGEFALALSLLAVRARKQTELAEVVAYWQAYLEERAAPRPEKKEGEPASPSSRRRRRRRPRRRPKPPTAAA